MGKKFACGSSVVNNDPNPQSVDIQGDFGDEAVELICAEFKVPEEKVSILMDATKKKGKGH
eukprot:NODE_9624_length_334_cov_133.516129.p4 GENE.NODE_9624_length_334_cov_133.516129~~NODE_9624_length_334_cov_133.516129.p4  ORF type:complete len:61 (+),score=32.55 NODE_9624_length_334_cov_133.516129:3-185(+)